MDEEGKEKEEEKKEEEKKEKKEEEENARKKRRKSQRNEPSDSFKQPKLLTGGSLRSYQVEGVKWLISLYENGLNGILADEMGLGKTIQTISFLAFLWEKGIKGPFLICAPLSTLANWHNEFTKFTPNIPALVYHGSAQERSKLRSENSALFFGRGKMKQPADSAPPVIITSYEMILTDFTHFNKVGNWKYLVVDEGHRLKNSQGKLLKKLQALSTDNRLLLTGTPLQNNLAELWSLLHFLLPDVFDDLESFQNW
jgi:ATP-dependent DNA helicase